MSDGAPATTALLTDPYELTMLQAAIADGSSGRRCTFEVFARRLPNGRRYGVVAGTERVLQAVADFHFDPESLDHLATWHFDGDIYGYREGDLFFPGSPVLSVTGSFASAVILETVVLSIMNHDCAIASAAARMSSAGGRRPLLGKGAGRTHENAAVAAARAAYIAGFAATSNLAAGQRYG